MNALEHEPLHRRRGARSAPSVPTPRAILVVSAHWYINATAVTAMAAAADDPRLLRLSRELFAVDYPAPGEPGARRGGRRDRRSRRGSGSTRTAGASTTAPGRCWCTRSRRRTFPSCSSRSTRSKPFDYHVDLGARLAPLRERGVLIVGSGNVVHNLARSTGAARRGFDWARRFDDAARAVITDERRATCRALRSHADFDSARPDARPLHPAALLRRPGGAPRTPPTSLIDGYAMGSLSMTAYTLDAKCPIEAATAVRQPACPIRQSCRPKTRTFDPGMSHALALEPGGLRAVALDRGAKRAPDLAHVDTLAHFDLLLSRIL